MIARYYICDKCEYSFVTYQPMHEPLLKKCPKCKKKSLYQDLSGQYSSVKHVETFGQLADKNTSKLGQYKIEQLEKERQENKKRAKLETLKQLKVVSPETTELPETSKKWYNPNGVDLSKALKPILNDKEKTKKYIIEGE